MDNNKRESDDDDVEMEAEVVGAARLPQSVTLTQARNVPQAGNNRRKKQGVDLHDALYRHNDETKSRMDRGNKSGGDKAKARKGEVEFTKESSDERKFKRIKCIQACLCIAYLAIVLALAFLLQENLILLALLFLLNFLVINYGGIFAIRALVFPFSVWLIRDGVDGQNIIKYQTDFASLLDKSYIILRLISSDPNGSAEQPMGGRSENLADDPTRKHVESKAVMALVENREYFKNVTAKYTQREINGKLKSLFDLVMLYADTNSQIVEQWKRQQIYRQSGWHAEFSTLTAIMVGLKEIFDGLKLRIKNPFGEFDDYTFQEYFGDETQLFLSEKPVKLVRNDATLKLLEKYEGLVMDFRRFLRKANAPINCGCCRVSCCGLWYWNLFHSNDQLEQMLEKNFDGRRFTVRSQDGAKLDCMFFPFNDEKVVTVAEMTGGQKGSAGRDLESGGAVAGPPRYLQYPTIIFFNPNAQNYQSQVHSPNAFWLKLFVSNNINVLAWNYRSYGRSQGVPDPFSSYHDSESMLKFLVEQLGVKGKIGCFGRSLGGTMATHIARNYPQFIDFLFVDRSLGNLQRMSESSFLGPYSKFIYFYFSRNWVVNSDKNFHEVKCFKLLTQDPNDATIDQYCALNAQVARVTCETAFGAGRYESPKYPLRVERTFNTLRLLFLIESKLSIAIRAQKGGKAKKGSFKKKNRALGYAVNEEDADPAYSFDAAPAVGAQSAGEKDTKSQKSGGYYSTDVDQLARSKRGVALEERLKRLAGSGELSHSQIDSLIERGLKDHFKQYESLSNSLLRVVVLLNELHGGIIKLGHICHPNHLGSPECLSLFLDGLFTYGSRYISIRDPYTIYSHQKQRLKGVRDIILIQKQLEKSKDDIKNLNIAGHDEEVSLHSMVAACFTNLHRFFDSLKKLLKKSEQHCQFDEKTVGHLVPLTVGHRDRPTDTEVRYIKTVMKQSGFIYEGEESAESPVIHGQR